jgi:hypothetical protein
MTVLDVPSHASTIQPSIAADHAPAAKKMQPAHGRHLISPEPGDQEIYGLLIAAPSPWPRVFPGL